MKPTTLTYRNFVQFHQNFRYSAPVYSGSEKRKLMQNNFNYCTIVIVSELHTLQEYCLLVCESN